jgi:CO/xanthine dehydrogenase FAD-binding subunit
MGSLTTLSELAAHAGVRESATALAEAANEAAMAGLRDFLAGKGS